MLDIQNYIQKLGDDSLSSEEQALALQEIEKSLVQSQLKHEEVVQSSTDLVVEAVKSIEDTVYTKFKELSTSESMKGPKGNNGRDGKDGKDGKDGVGYNGKDGKDGVDGIDGEDGRYVTDVEIDFDDTLLVTLSDNTTIKTTKEIKGPKGDMGPQGLRGSNGNGVVVGGSTGQVLTKVSNTDYDVTWSTNGAGTVTSVAATVPSFLSVTGSPITSSGTLALDYSGTALPISNGGTGKTAATASLANLQGYTTTANISFATTAATGDGTTATLTFATQASAPFAVGSTIFVAGVTPSGYNTATGALVTACTTTTVSYLNATSAVQTVAGTVTAAPVLTNTSSYYQLFTGTAIGGVVLPVASTLQQGWTYKIYNASSGGLTVYSSGGNSILAITPNAGGTFTCIDTTLNTAAAWRSSVSDFGALTGTSGSVVLSVSPTITGTLGFTGTSTSGANFASGQTTGSTNIVTIQTTGITTVGGTATTGALILGRSTGSQYIDIANGATASSTTASGTASSITTTVLTVGGTVTGTFVVGMQLTGTNVLPNTYITTLGTGTGGAGTYNINQTQTVASTTITGTTQKTISIGTAGVSGSKTVITLGSAVSGATSTTTLNGVFKQQNYTVATLPSASTNGVGARSFVTDALAPTFGATVVTGGAVAVPVYSDGTNWKVG